VIPALIRLPGVPLASLLINLQSAGRCVIFGPVIKADLLSRREVPDA